MQASMTGGTNGQILDMNPEIPVEGGSGYGQLQRALNETGVV